MKRRYLIGGLLLAICGGTAAFTLTRTTVPFISFAEARASGRTCQIVGQLIRPSVRLDPSMKRAWFRLRDRKSGEEMEIYYHNPVITLNPNLATAEDVQVIGVYDPVAGRFNAEQVITQCNSKYQSQGFRPSPEQRSAPGDVLPSGR